MRWTNTANTPSDWPIRYMAEKAKKTSQQMCDHHAAGLTPLCLTVHFSFDTHNLFVKHLPASIDDAALKELFAPYGEVVSAHVMLDPKTSQSRGFG